MALVVIGAIIAVALNPVLGLVLACVGLVLVVAGR